MRDALTRASWDLVISDYSMPGFSGTAALNLLQQQGVDVPFIFVSGTIGEDVAVAAMKAGASDYVLKDKLKRLIPAIERELRDAEMRRERRRAHDIVVERTRLAELASEVGVALTSGHAAAGNAGALRACAGPASRRAGRHASGSTPSKPQSLELLASAGLPASDSGSVGAALPGRRSDRPDRPGASAGAPRGDRRRVGLQPRMDRARGDHGVRRDTRSWSKSGWSASSPSSPNGCYRISCSTVSRQSPISSPWASSGGGRRRSCGNPRSDSPASSGRVRRVSRSRRPTRGGSSTSTRRSSR